VKTHWKIVLVLVVVVVGWYLWKMYKTKATTGSSLASTGGASGGASGQIVSTIPTAISQQASVAAASRVQTPDALELKGYALVPGTKNVMPGKPYTSTVI
jgi:hypothetical protein